MSQPTYKARLIFPSNISNRSGYYSMKNLKVGLEQHNLHMTKSDFGRRLYELSYEGTKDELKQWRKDTSNIIHTLTKGLLKPKGIVGHGGTCALLHFQYTEVGQDYPNNDESWRTLALAIAKKNNRW